MYYLSNLNFLEIVITITMKVSTSSIVLLISSAVQVYGNDNGLALTPPLGWRSWNLYGGVRNFMLFI